MSDSSFPSSNEQNVAGAFRSAMFWNVANMGLSQVITIAVFIFLTYRLDPVVFGIFALGVVIIDYFNFQGQSSAVDAVIQKQDFSPKALSSSFWAAMVVIILATIICAYSGGLMAASMKQEELRYVLPVLALTLLPLPFGIAPGAILLRNHDFKGFAIRGILGSILGGIAAIVVALSAYADWALVAQRGVTVTSSAVFLMTRTRWFPSFQFERTMAVSFLKDTGRIFAAQGVAVSVRRFLDVVVGLFFGAAAVGLLRIASRLINALYGTVAAPIGSLWVVLLSKEGLTKQDHAFLFVRLTQMTAFVCMPVFLGVALTSEEIVNIALDEDYVGALPMLVILALGGLTIPLAYFRNHAFTALKKLNLLLGYSVIDLIVVAVASLALANFGLIPAILSLPIMMVVKAMLTLPVLIKAVESTWTDYFKAIAPAYLACTAMAIAVLLIGRFSADWNDFYSLGLKAAVGAAVYFVYLFVFHRAWTMVAIGMFLRSKSATEPQAV